MSVIQSTWPCSSRLHPQIRLLLDIHDTNISLRYHTEFDDEFVSNWTLPTPSSIPLLHSMLVDAFVHVDQAATLMEYTVDEPTVDNVSSGFRFTFKNTYRYVPFSFHFEVRPAVGGREDRPKHTGVGSSSTTRHTTRTYADATAQQRVYYSQNGWSSFVTNTMERIKNDAGNGDKMRLPSFPNNDSQIIPEIGGVSNLQAGEFPVLECGRCAQRFVRVFILMHNIT